MGPSAIQWVTAFIDLPHACVEQGVEFWQRVTGYAISPWRGANGEFTTFLPLDGDPFLRAQRTFAGAGGCHLDLHATDPGRLAERALALGARPHEHAGPVRALLSPGGMPFCSVSHHAESSRRPLPARWLDGHSSLIDQVCLDIPASAYDLEREFWARLTGWQVRGGALPEFCYLAPPMTGPIRILLQRLGATCEAGKDSLLGLRVSAHIDLATSDVAAEQARHEALGATATRQRRLWTTMRAPAGGTYCITAGIPRPEH